MLFHSCSVRIGQSESVVWTFRQTHDDTTFRAFLDDTDYTGRLGGKAYATYGIGTSGAVVVVRPDGYVGMIAPLNGVEDLSEYFTSFLNPSGGIPNGVSSD